MTIRIALGAALVLAASVPARAAARFLVGASAADITPPLAATAASNPANRDATGLYNGPHLFSLGVTEFAPGVGKVYLVRDSPLGPGRRTLRFLDVNGQPEAAPSTQTRGIRRGKRRHVWVDVFPDTTGLTTVPPR